MPINRFPSHYSLHISVDSIPTKKAWASAIDVKETNMLADFWPHGQIAREYGLFIEDLGVSNRANVVIAPDRAIEWIKIYDMPEIPDIEEIIRFIAAQV